MSADTNADSLSTEDGPGPEISLVERSDVGASMSVDITRGTGTRDQEKYSLKGKGKTAEDAIDEFEKQLEALEQRFAQRIRNLQIEVETESDDKNEA